MIKIYKEIKWNLPSITPSSMTTVKSMLMHHKTFVLFCNNFFYKLSKATFDDFSKNAHYFIKLTTYIDYYSLTYLSSSHPS